MLSLVYRVVEFGLGLSTNCLRNVEIAETLIPTEETRRRRIG